MAPPGPVPALDGRDHDAQQLQAVEEDPNELDVQLEVVNGRHGRLLLEVGCGLRVRKSA
jgi:hypothetical protein